MIEVNGLKVLLPTLRLCVATLLVLTFVGAAAAARQPQPSHKKTTAKAHATTHQRTGKGSVAATHKKGSPTRGKLAAKRPRGQRAIDSERARQIQEALIRENYLDGAPSGVWDQRSKDAMARYQRANGWQDKVTPDARALIKLGLGPRHDGLLNPDRAAISNPLPPAGKVNPGEAGH